MKKIKSSTHFITNLNSNKKSRLLSFIAEYRIATQFYIDYLWNNKISFVSGKKKEIKTLDIKNDLLDCPQFLYNKDLGLSSKLSARALSAAAAQALGLVSSAIENRKRCKYVLTKTYNENKRTRRLSNLLDTKTIIKPNADNVNPELNSLNVKIEKSNIKHFDTIITLSALGQGYGKIIIPINHNKHSRKLQAKNNSHLLNSILLCNNKIHLRWEYEVDEKDNGIIVGADSGISSVITLSDHQQTSSDKHSHTLNSILKKIVRKKKGSKSFLKALNHRDNFIRWSINQLNLSNIKQIRLEKVSNFRHKRNVGKFLNYSSEALIRSKLIDFAEDSGVRVSLQSSAYRSQRCSSCGYVYSGNRKGKLFSCKHCLFQADADYNASCNHEQNLPSSNWLLYHSNKPKKFFWNQKGFFNLDDSELTVPDTKKSDL